MRFRIGAFLFITIVGGAMSSPSSSFFDQAVAEDAKSDHNRNVNRGGASSSFHSQPQEDDPMKAAAETSSSSTNNKHKHLRHVNNNDMTSSTKGEERALNTNDLSLEDVMPDEEERKSFIERHKLKADTSLSVQVVTESAVFDDGTTFHLDGRDEGTTIDYIFAPGAQNFLDGEERPLPDVTAYRKELGDATILVVVNGGAGTGDTGGRELVWATKIDRRTGSTTSLERVKGRAFARVKSTDYDPRKLSKYRFEDAIPAIVVDNNDGNNRQRKQLLLLERDQTSTEINFHRDTAGARALGFSCPQYDVIELLVAYDSTFCNLAGVSDAATAASAIIAGVNMKYSVTGLCKKVTVSQIDGSCTQNTDPYVFVRNSNKLCGNQRKGILEQFRNYWNSISSPPPGDVRHLLFGDFSGNTIGCAYISNLCTDDAYGVNWVGFTGDMELRVRLVTHELGHNAGSPHDPYDGFIMSPAISTGGPYFSPDSVQSISQYVGQRPSSCIGTETGGACESDSECNDGYDCTVDSCDGGTCSNVFDDSIQGCGQTGGGGDCDSGPDFSCGNCCNGCCRWVGGGPPFNACCN